MHRRAFLGWLARGAALVVVAPAADVAALFTPSKLQASATGFVRAWLHRNPGCRRVYISRPLFEALEMELKVCKRWTIADDDTPPFESLLIKGVTVIESEWLRDWSIVDAAAVSL